VECENNSDTSSNKGKSVSESFRKYLSSIPGKHDVKELQKTAILGTAHIVWVTNIKLQKFNLRTNISLPLILTTK
jgi:hypothetical protein